MSSIISSSSIRFSSFYNMFIVFESLHVRKTECQSFDVARALQTKKNDIKENTCRSGLSVIACGGIRHRNSSLVSPYSAMMKAKAPSFPYETLAPDGFSWRSSRIKSPWNKNIRIFNGTPLCMNQTNSKFVVAMAVVFRGFPFKMLPCYPCLG